MDNLLDHMEFISDNNETEMDDLSEHNKLQDKKSIYLISVQMIRELK